MILEYPRTSLPKENTRLNHCIYLSDHNTVYKDSTASFSVPRFLSKRILFVSDMGEIEGLVGPLNVLSDDYGIYGYEAEYLKEYSTLQDLIESGKILEYSFEQKKLLLLKLFRCLRKINEQYEFGDINLSNIMVSKDDAKLIDFENGRPLDTNYPQLCKYHFFKLSKTESDSFKLLIDALCMLYNTNFEFELSKASFNYFPSLLRYYQFDKSIVSFVSEFVKAVNGDSSETLYFDECLSSLRRLPNSDISVVQENMARRI